MMFSELTALLDACPSSSGRLDYTRALVADNCLGKQTVSTRRLTLQRLSELYALDPEVPIFRLLRLFWSEEDRAQPLLALSAALARDPLLRATAPVILSMRAGEEMARQQMTDAIRAAVDDRLNESILDKVVRNTASSWTQSGHLDGRARKKRRLVEPTPITTAFALLLGYMLGTRGRALFDTLFTRVLDRDENALTFLAMDAKRLGLLDIKSAGGLTTVSMEVILTEKERKLIHGSN